MEVELELSDLSDLENLLDNRDDVVREDESWAAEVEEYAVVVTDSPETDSREDGLVLSFGTSRNVELVDAIVWIVGLEIVDILDGLYLGLLVVLSSVSSLEDGPARGEDRRVRAVWGLRGRG
jgi:hypothetical protein